MSKLPTCRLLLEAEPRSGDWNMAVDAVLLESAVERGVATFRWYRWSEPTLSVGYFQSLADIEADPRWANVPKVRRLTGGGAILHDREWTYSLAIPAGLSLYRRPEELYDVVHTAIIDLLRDQGCDAALRGETTKLSAEPVLCFARRDSHDVVCGDHKLLGSAQRRRKGAILQHGSLLLRASEFTPQHFGVEELGLPAGLSVEVLRRLPRRFAADVRESLLTEEELVRVKRWSPANR